MSKGIFERYHPTNIAGYDVTYKNGKYYANVPCSQCSIPRRTQIQRTGKVRRITCQPCQAFNRRGTKGTRLFDKSGYVRIYLQPDEFFFPMVVHNRNMYGGYVLEHRLVMAKHLGRCLHRWEIVHHKNGIKDDNRIENLQIVSDDRHKQITLLETHISYLEKLLAKYNIPF